MYTDIDTDNNDSFFSCSSSSNSFLSLDSEPSVDLNLHDRISTLFSQYPDNLNIAHINAQSIPCHYSDLLASFDSTHLVALLISESFLKPSLPSIQYSLPGFVLIRNDRVGKGGGGVAIYLRSEIPYRVISVSPSTYSESAEHLFLEITLYHTKVFLGVLYSPNLNINYFDTLDTLLNNFCPVYSHVILIGDFNTCIIKNDLRTYKLKSLMSSYNLEILPLSATHHFPNCTASFLDLIIVSSLNSVANHGQICASFSYHDLIYLSYRVRPPKRKPHFRYLRSYNGINLETLRSDASLIDWSPVIECYNIEDKVINFNSLILDLYNHHTPVKRVKIRHNPAPWITADIKDLMARRDKAKRRYKRYPLERNLISFKILRNRCNRLCRDAKRRYFHDTLTSCDTAKAWNFLRSVGVGKYSASVGSEINLDSLNEHFANPPVIVSSFTKARTLLELSKCPIRHYSSFNFTSLTEDDSMRSVLAISSTAMGNDNICSKIITLILPFLLPILTHIFNFSLSSCCFPSSWKLAHIIPIPKVSNPSSATHYRPISILPFLSKVLEHIVHTQLTKFLNRNNILSTFQSGFRPGHSTTTALLKVTDDIRCGIDQKYLTVLVLLDFSSAFNSIDFDILLSILHSINVSPSTIQWFDSYLRGRSQCIRINETLSKWCNLATGVPQGGVLSPLLFSIFINCITQVISSNFHLYADDLQLYRHFLVTEANSALLEINNDLNKIDEWSSSYGLVINPKKSQAMIIGTRFTRKLLDFSSLPTLQINGIPLSISETLKNLGIIMDCKLTWNAHITEISRKIYYTFHSLKCLQHFLPLSTKISLVQTLIFPILDYADVCYLDATEEQLNKLERLQNLCIRYIFGLKKYDHVSSYRKQLKWLPIRLRRNTRILCLLFNILYNPTSPPYLRDRFHFAHSPDAVCRSHLKTLLNFPSSKTKSYSHSFTVHAVRLWNSLPAAIREAQSVSVFKRRVKEHYLSLSSQ
ncbi:unnamed protein product [Parnassius mnemosyne]|uniref:Reverse transcriptase domain-containing protein n=1 Tax=Parnassius mnemosyne TaxID=213953 RepID=A0AAV1K7Z8_9NEOP